MASNGESSTARLRANSFVPRPFPPPSLTGVPLEYIIDTLHNLAPHYWNNLETADCSIIFPLDTRRASFVAQDPNISIHEPYSDASTNAHDPAGLGRRVTAPDLNFGPTRLLMKLHVDYLSAQSTLLRGLFSGSLPLDLINTSHMPQSASRPSCASPTFPAVRLPRLLPSSPHHPVVYLPIPDPTSFHYLVTWMYFGATDGIEEALRRRAIRWEGLARNVEYLGMGEEIKRFLGRWYAKWIQTARARPPLPDDADSEMDEEEPTSASTANGNTKNGGAAVEDPQRGRSRDRVPVSS